MVYYKLPILTKRVHQMESFIVPLFIIISSIVYPLLWILYSRTVSNAKELEELKLGIAKEYVTIDGIEKIIAAAILPLSIGISNMDKRLQELIREQRNE